MNEAGDGGSSAPFHRASSRGRGKGVIRKFAGSDDLYQIRCIYVDPNWSQPWTLDFIRGHYCYEGARCVIELVAARSGATGGDAWELRALTREE